jgi:hypothetical protein
MFEIRYTEAADLFVNTAVDITASDDVLQGLLAEDRFGEPVRTGEQGERALLQPIGLRGSE